MSNGCDALEEICSERDEAVAVDVPRRQGVALAIGSRVDLLTRHDVDVLRVPDFDCRRLVSLLAVSLGLLISCSFLLVSGSVLVFLRTFLVPLADAHEYRSSIVGPRRPAESHDARAGRQAGRRQRVEDHHRGQALPGEDGVRRAVVPIVGRAPEDGQIVCVLAPRQPRINRLCRVEHAERAGVGIEELNPVTSLVLRADREREESALVLPRELGHVPERRVSSRFELPDDERRADGSLVRRRGRIRGVLALGRVAFHGEVCSARVEGERLDAIHRRHLARGELQGAELAVNRLLLLA